MKILYKTSIALAGTLTLVLVANVAYATHFWGNYHWGRTANPLPLEMGDNVSSDWDSYLLQASDDWNVSPVLNTSVVAGKAKPRNCRPKDGRLEVCNHTYGNTGWVGLAQIWISGNHIVKGVVKLNDTYVNTPFYNTPEWRSLLACQEIGHIFGMGHQDTNFNNANLGTCMDYTNNPGSNQHPNAHDYQLLDDIYAHLDSVNTYILTDGGGDDGGGGKGNNGKGGGKGKPQDVDWSSPSEWGRQVSGHVFERNLGKGKKVITDVFWVEGRGDR